MNRRTKVVAVLKKIAAEQPGAGGATAADIAARLGIGRSNASMELNELARDGLIVKYPGKPVRFAWLGEGRAAAVPAARPVPDTAAETAAPADPFAASLGADSGLRAQVEQAKAAVLYPPSGLHTLLLGPTGSGQTFFARKMFEFARSAAPGAIGERARLVTFNCADYAHNPQLLMSQLFGHAKGAFTGAVADTAGLVAAADGGVLFLDEIHRLPPEGQEMLFYLMDQGWYRRLGETAGQRACRTMVIGATTESPQAALLASFVRRFPVKIELPSLAEWTLADRMALLAKMIADESARVALPVRISAECIRAFLLYDCPGNIGQLRNDLKLACARAFLAGRGRPGPSAGLVVKSAMLPPHISVPAALRHLDSDELLALFDNAAGAPAAAPACGWRATLAAEAAAFQAAAPAAPDWTTFPALFAAKYPALGEMPPEKLRALRQSVWSTAGQKLLAVTGQVLPELTGRRGGELLAVHLAAYLRDLAAAGRSERRPLPGDIPAAFEAEKNLAARIIGLARESCQLAPPPDEIFLLTLFLALFPAEGRAVAAAGLAVMALGPGTASGMAAVANQLEGHPVVAALDIPVGRDDDEAWLEKAAALVKTADRGRGVLLLVDMQPLVLWGEIIARRTGVTIRVLDNVSTALLVQAVREAPYARDPDALVARLKIRRSERDRMISIGGPPATRIVAAACLTGEGTARCVKELLDTWLQPYPDIEVRTVDLDGTPRNAGGRLAALRREGRLAAVVGSVDPAFDGIPFIPLEEILAGSGKKRLADILGLDGRIAGVWDAPELEHLLAQYLRFLDPRRMIALCGGILKHIETGLGRPLLPHQIINLTVHLSCWAERSLTGAGRSFWPREAEIRRDNPAVWQLVQQAVKPLEAEFAVTVVPAEIAFITHYLTTV